MFNAYLTTRLAGMLVFYGLNQELKKDESTGSDLPLSLSDIYKKSSDSNLILKEDDYKLLYQPVVEGDKKVVKSLLIHFNNPHQAVLYYLHNRDLKMLHDK